MQEACTKFFTVRTTCVLVCKTKKRQIGDRMKHNGIAMVISLALILTNDTFICCQVRGIFYCIILKKYLWDFMLYLYVSMLTSINAMPIS